MNYLTYIRMSDLYMQSLFQCMDNAWAAEKMYVWSNLGDDNVAWSVGPYISSGANCKQIDRSHPYCLRLSNYSSRLSGYQLGPNPKIENNGGVHVGHVDDLVKANIIIPTVAVGMQFSLLESLDFSLVKNFFLLNKIDSNKGAAKRYDRKPVKDRMQSLNEFCSECIGINYINAYISVSNFRNKLVHEPNIFCVDPFVAMDVYVVCQAVAYEIHRVMYGELESEQLVHRKKFWSHRISMFNDVLDFN